MSKMGHVIIFLLNCTWGIIQSIMGLALFLIFINKPHYLYNSSILTVNAFFRSMKIKGGMALGLFVFTTMGIEKELVADNDLVKHEYGHVLQSALLGPLFLPIVGLPSLIWARLFAGWRKIHNKDYFSFYTESWADKWGKRKV